MNRPRIRLDGRTYVQVRERGRVLVQLDLRRVAQSLLGHIGLGLVRNHCPGPTV